MSLFTLAAGLAVAPHLRPPHPPHTTELHLRPPATVRYEVVSTWAENQADQATRTTIVKTLTVGFSRTATGFRVTLDTDPPRLLQPNPPPLAETARLLAGLYRRLEFDAAPTGQLRHLLNLPALHATWTEIKAALTARYSQADALTARLIAATESQLRHPEAIFASLRHDYSYQLLFNALPGQRYDTAFTYARDQRLSQFLAGADLCFREVLELLPAEPPAPRATLRGRGTLDATHTPLASLATRLQARLGPDAPPLAPDALRGTYDTTYELDKATGLPVTITAAISAHYPGHYRKDYTLTIQQLATL